MFFYYHYYNSIILFFGKHYYFSAILKNLFKTKKFSLIYLTIMVYINLIFIIKTKNQQWFELKYSKLSESSWIVFYDWKIAIKTYLYFLKLLIQVF